jgi:hypothetical protein
MQYNSQKGNCRIDLSQPLRQIPMRASSLMADLGHIDEPTVEAVRIWPKEMEAARRQLWCRCSEFR